jgi:hypothetical protein
MLAVLYLPFGLLLNGVGSHAPAPSHPITTINGVVFDSIAMRGLKSAIVQIADAAGGSFSQSTETDANGNFTFADVPKGTYLLGYFHPKLDSLALASPTLRVDVRTDQPVTARLAIPSTTTIVRAVCGAKTLKDSTGLLLGYLKGADNSMPRGNGTVNVRWAELSIEKRGIRRVVPTVDALTGTTGQFALCGVPTEMPLMLQASNGADSSGAFEITVPSSGLLYRDIYVAPVTRSVVATDSGPAVPMMRGNGRLRGSVVGANTRPIPGARVSVWGTGIEVTSDPEGRFSLLGLPSGTHMVEVRAVGFTPATQPVDIVQGAPGSTEIELANLAFALDTVRVTAQRQRIFTNPRDAAFERRLKYSVGHVIDEAEIEKRRPIVLTDLLRSVPGVLVVPGRRSGVDVFMRGGQAILGSGYCRPDIWIDGTRVTNDELFPFDMMVAINDVRAVEVYAHAATVPPDLASTSGCGVIGVWTGARRK